MPALKYKEKIHKLQEEKDKKIFSLRDSGKTLLQIGDSLGISREAVRKRLIKLGYTKEPKNNKVDK